MCQSKLIAGLVFPELNNSSRFEISVEPIIMTPDFSVEEVRAMIGSLFDSTRSETTSLESNSVECFVKLEVDQDQINENSEHSISEEETNMSKKEFFSINQTKASDLGTGTSEIVGQIETQPTLVHSKSTNKGKKYNQHSCEFKLKAIEDAKKNTNQAVANKLGMVRHKEKFYCNASANEFIFLIKLYFPPDHLEVIGFLSGFQA